MVHSVYNVVTWSSFSVTGQHKVSGCIRGILPLCDKFAYDTWMVVEGCVMDTPNLGRYEASWEAVPPPSKTSNREMYSL